MSAKKKGKPGEYPAYLFDAEKLFDWAYCIWLCSGCGAPYYFRQTGSNKHGGPVDRLADRRYSDYLVGPCWRSRTYGVKCVTPKATRVLYHQGEEPPEQSLLDTFTAQSRQARAAARAYIKRLGLDEELFEINERGEIMAADYPMFRRKTWAEMK